MGFIPPAPPRRPARLSESGEDIDYLEKISPPSKIPSNKIRDAISRMDPSYRAYRRLVNSDPTYRPVKAYTYEQAVQQNLLAAPGTPSPLDLAMERAPTQIAYDSQETAPQAPYIDPGADVAAVGNRNELPSSFEEV